MSLGEAFITVRADTSEFADDLKTKLQPIIDAAKATIKVSADTSQFVKDVTAVSDAVGKTSVTITVNADTAPFTAAVNAAVAEASAKTVTITVRANTSELDAAVAGTTPAASASAGAAGNGVPEILAANQAIADSSRNLADAEVADIARVAAASQVATDERVADSIRLTAANPDITLDPKTGSFSSAATNSSAVLAAQKALQDGQLAEEAEFDAKRIVAAQAEADALRAIDDALTASIEANAAKQAAASDAAKAGLSGFGNVNLPSAAPATGLTGFGTVDTASIASATDAIKAQADASAVAATAQGDLNRAEDEGATAATSAAAAHAALVDKLKATILAQAELKAATDEARDALVEEGLIAETASAGLDKTAASADRSHFSLSGVFQTLVAGAVALAPFAIGGAAALGLEAFGLKGADAVRSLTLELQTLEPAAKNINDQVLQLQALANQGLNLTSLGTDLAGLLQSGVSGSNAQSALGALANIGAAQGNVGAQLQTFVDSASTALDGLAAKAKITATTFASSVASLGLNVTSQQVFDQIKKNLDLTTAQLDALIAKGGLTGAAVANGALSAANAGSQGALANAVNTSPTQAIASLKSSVEDALAGAVNAPQVAGAINSIKDELVSAFSSPTFKADLSDFTAAITNIAEKAIPLVVTGFGDILPLVTKFINDLTSPTAEAFFKDIGNALSSIFSTIQALAPAALVFIDGMIKAVGLVASILKPVADVLTAIAGTTAGKVLLEIAGAITAIILLSKLGPVATAINLIGDAAKYAAVQLGLMEGAEEGVAGVGIAGKLAGVAETIGSFTAPLLAVGVAGAYAGDKLVGLAANLLGYQSNADYAAEQTKKITAANEDLAASFTAAGRPVIDLGYAFAGLNQAQHDGTSASQAAVAALEAQGRTADQVTTDLEAMGVSAQNAADAVNGVNFSAADAQLAALSDSAVVAAGNLSIAGAEAQAAYSALNGGTFGPIEVGADQTGQLPGITHVQPVAPSIFPAAGGASGPSAAQQAKTAAASALDSALSSFTDAVGGAKTVQAVNDAFATLQKAIDTADTALGQKEPTGLKTYLAKEETALEALATQQQLIAAAISASATEVSSALSYADVVTSQGATDLSKLTLVVNNAHDLVVAQGNAVLSDGATGGATNPFLAGLQTKLQQLQQFAADIAAAQKAGLDPSLVQQFLSAGPDSDPQLKSILASGTASIAAINSTQQAITAAANALGDEAAKSTLAAGVAVADGFIQGLEAQSDKLTAAATKLGNQIAAAVKKALGIKSPSVVMRALGVHAGTGLHMGLTDTLPQIEAVASRMAKAAQPVMGATALDRARGVELHGAAGPSVTHHREINAPININMPGATVTPQQVEAHLHGALARLAR